MKEVTQSFANEEHVFMTKEYYDELIKCKERFVSDTTYDPRQNPCMYREIAESWLRCRENKADYRQPQLGYRLSQKEFDRECHKYRQLLEITKPLILRFKHLAISSGYALYLVDREGTFLIHEGGVLELPVDRDRSMAGMRWDEKIAGTTAHSLTLLHKKPFNLYGHENYHYALRNVVASAAPIHSEDRQDKIIAALVLVQQNSDTPWTEEFQKLCSNSLGLITALSAAVESQLRLQKSFDAQKVTTEMLNISLSMMDEGIITIDHNGKIIFINSEGMRMLRIPTMDFKDLNILSFLSADTSLMDILVGQQEATIEEFIMVGAKRENYIINVRPIRNPHSDKTEMALLTLNNANKVNAMSAKRAGSASHFTFSDIVGKSGRMKKVIRLARQYAKTEENILLIGESGTGKELFSQAIHNETCPHGPFVAVNCAALPRELIESELFGYEGGSFTGANRSGRPGKIELAEGGTLFLDEIGDMPLELQAVLLRVLQDKQVTRIGARRSIQVNFRLITATNQDLKKSIQDHLFREDLYYRISVLKLAIPPLRDRQIDILLLAQTFLEKYCLKAGRKIAQLSPEAKEIIASYPWPGNVRELENTMVHAVIDSEYDTIGIHNLPEDITHLYQDSIAESFYKKTITNQIDLTQVDTADFVPLNELEIVAIKNALKKTNSNIIESASLLGLGKSTLYRKIKEYDIKV